MAESSARSRRRENLGAVARVLEGILPGISAWTHGRLPQRARRRVETGDLVQEAAVGALQKLPDELLARPDTVRAYLKQSIKNRIVDEIRRAGKVELPDYDSGELARDPSDSPLDRVIESEDRIRFRRALAVLDEDSQLLVVGRVDLDMSYDELALATGRASADAARVATRRAVLRLAREVGKRRAEVAD
jgi:RNA polymerase sigma factor (sigma-70 family)